MNAHIKLLLRNAATTIIELEEELSRARLDLYDMRNKLVLAKKDNVEQLVSLLKEEANKLEIAEVAADEVFVWNPEQQ